MFVKTTVVNTQIELENIEMEFNNCGIYIISGENGCGKSSVLKKIVFEENNIRFSNEDTQCLFNQDRGQVIGYVEQDPLAYDCSLHKYLTRYGDSVDGRRLKAYLEQFDLGYLRLNQNITGLSGGELIKANIIASLLRETPYIFMDEPTNNLDNEGVRRFVDIVTEYAKEHTVVIVSHDPRMQFDEVTEYVIKDSRILKKASMKNVAENKGKKSRCGLSLKKVISDYIVSPGGVASMFFMALVMCLIVFGNYIVYYSTMATEKSIHKKDVIVGYKVDEQYDELNKIYTGSENIDVDEDKFYQMLYFKDLEKLIEDERIIGILLPDVEYIDKLNQKIVEYRSGKSAIDQVLLFSLPEYILKNFGGQITLPQNVLMLKEGRLPQDNCKEVVISEGLAEEYFGISVTDAVGSVVGIQGEDYTVVGIGFSDIAVISYSDGLEYGYFSFRNNSQKVSDLEDYLVRADYYLTNGTTEEIFILNSGFEKEVLDYLIKNYPAENYASYEFENVFNKITNKTASQRLVLINVVIIIIVSVVIIVINSKRLKINRNKAISINNCYCRSGYIQRVYRRINYCEYCVCTIITLIAVRIFINEISLYCAVSLILGCILLLVQLVGKKSGDL